MDREKLIEDAERAYDRNDQEWFNSREEDELIYLWTINPWGMAYGFDDEVYEALYERGFFAEENDAWSRRKVDEMVHKEGIDFDAIYHNLTQGIHR